MNAIEVLFVEKMMERSKVFPELLKEVPIAGYVQF
jgi:hypothetical protein